VVCVDSVNILGGNIYTIRKNSKGLVVASKENGLEVNAGKTMYTVLYRVHEVTV